MVLKEEIYIHRHIKYHLLSESGDFLKIFQTVSEDYKNFSFMRFSIFKKTLILDEIFITKSSRENNLGSIYIKYLEDNYDIDKIELEMDCNWEDMDPNILKSFYLKNGFIYTGKDNLYIKNIKREV